jgi:hypothetical protein
MAAFETDEPTPVDELTKPGARHREPLDRRLTILRTISPLVSIEQDWVDSDFVAARIWTE